MSGFYQTMMRNKSGGSSGEILYQPALDGTEAITTMSGQKSPIITNNTFSGYASSGNGGSGYLSAGWDNTGLWELTYKGRITASNGYAGLLLVCNSTRRDYNLINTTLEHWRYNGSSSKTFNYTPSVYGTTMHNIKITKTDSTTLVIKVDDGASVTIDGFTALSQTNRCYIGVDSWGSGKYGIISDILVVSV